MRLLDAHAGNILEAHTNRSCTSAAICLLRTCACECPYVASFRACQGQELVHTGLLTNKMGLSSSSGRLASFLRNAEGPWLASSSYTAMSSAMSGMSLRLRASLAAAVACTLATPLGAPRLFTWLNILQSCFFVSSSKVGIFFVFTPSLFLAGRSRRLCFTASLFLGNISSGFFFVCFFFLSPLHG